MKSVLLSIKPQYCELIASGKKTVEVRKTRPKIHASFKGYIYCTKGSYNIYGDKKSYVSDELNFINSRDMKKAFCKTSGFNEWNGKVIGEFICDEITYLGNISTDPWCRLLGDMHERHKLLVNEQACLSENELLDYGGKYAWHVSNLKIYDKPKRLSEFCKPCECDFDTEKCRNCTNLDYNDLGIKCCDRRLTRPPQSWCYVEELKE